MPRNTLKTLLFSSLILLQSMQAKGSVTTSEDRLEDSLIVRAIFQDERHNFVKSEKLFIALYRLTGNIEYLIQAAKEAVLPGGEPKRVIALLRHWIKRHSKAMQDFRPVRMLVALYAKEGELQEAEPLVDRWLAHSKDPADLKVASTLKSDLGYYNKAVELLQMAYTQSKEDRLLLRIAVILDEKLHKKDEAIRLLETHIRLNPKTTIAIYFKLIELYAQENRLEKVLELYKRLYERNPQKYFLQKIIKLSLYTHDIDGLISLLEKYPQGNEDLLYRLYKEKRLYDKAIALARKRAQETREPKWLAEEAILRYEKAKEQRRISTKLLSQFRKLFDKALRMGLDDSLYLNYYGYTLIDHDLDIKRGISLVRRALEQQPDNNYYLDSLAWGLYKMGECTKAYKVMDRVIAEEGLNEPEIKMHWESIRKCMESDKAF